MKQILHEPGSRPIRIWTDDVDDLALQQLKNLAQLPFIAPHGVACMPDVHAGLGATVGSVIATDSAIIPSAVGVDIGCGMNAVRLSLTADQLPDNLAPVRREIEKRVPVGLGRGGSHRDRNAPQLPGDILQRYNQITDKHPGLFNRNTQVQLGTLGSGNHFIEVCLDQNDDVWVMLHSGSRGPGNVIGRYFIERAKRHMESQGIKLPDRDLAYLSDGSADFNDYVEAVQWAQDYAFENRRFMMKAVLAGLRKQLPSFEITQEAINCHHNYVEQEEHFGQKLWVTRKGAIRAREDDLGIIPGSMGQRSYIVRGKGNAESYTSCSHGAGRRMSRREARRRFTLDDLREQTKGVESRKDRAVIDEIPGAYKDIDEVMARQTDLVDVLYTLKQVVCVKGD
ncbi:MAG TPA: RtcB family protein [Burkholderiaceae bacterium]|nr:RtcB family protein [Burkholderiaceae bacterium]